MCCMNSMVAKYTKVHGFVWIRQRLFISIEQINEITQPKPIDTYNIQLFHCDNVKMDDYYFLFSTNANAICEKTSASVLAFYHQQMFSCSLVVVKRATKN